MGDSPGTYRQDLGRRLRYPSHRAPGEVRFFGISEQDLENEFFDFKNKYQTWDLLVGAAYRF